MLLFMLFSSYIQSLKEQRRPSTKASNSPNTEICALLQMPQSIPSQDIPNDDILTVQTSFNNEHKSYTRWRFT